MGILHIGAPISAGHADDAKASHRLHRLDQPAQYIRGSGTASAPPPPPPARGSADAAVSPPHASVSVRRVSLGDLAGVHATDTAHEEHRLKHDRPRLTFKPVHAVMAILLLAVMLSASLTMLIQQAIRYEQALSAVQTSSVSGSSTSRSGAGDNGVGDKTAADDDAEPGKPSSDMGSDASAGTQNDDSGATVDDDAGKPADGRRTDTQSADSVQTAPSGDGKIDLNTATSEELQTVKGIGPVTAERILAHRETIGRFTSVDQLLDVKGIGAKTLAKIRDEVTVR